MIFYRVRLVKPAVEKLYIPKSPPCYRSVLSLPRTTSGSRNSQEVTTSQ